MTAIFLSLLSLAKIPVKAYRKSDLRVLLMNPSIDLKDSRAVADAVPLDRTKFQTLLKEKLDGKVPEEEWKGKCLSEDVVRIILTPDPPKKEKNKYSRT